MDKKYIFGTIKDPVIVHYGMPRRSGRYPWGSGKNPYHHGRSASNLKSNTNWIRGNDADPKKGFVGNPEAARNAYLDKKIQQREYAKDFEGIDKEISKWNKKYKKKFNKIKRSKETVGKVTKKTIHKLDKEIKAVNPKYMSYSYWRDDRSAYTTNCASCSITYDMRRRGYDVTANSRGGEFKRAYSKEEHFKTTHEGMVRMYSKDGTHPKVYHPEIKYSQSGKTRVKMLDNYVKSMPDGARGVMCFKWANGSYVGGHAINWEKISGECVLIDTQGARYGGGVMTGTSREKLMNTVLPSKNEGKVLVYPPVSMFRTDDADAVSPGVMTYCKNRSGSVKHFETLNEPVLEHYGMPRRSGRYPWGSGKNPYHHSGRKGSATAGLDFRTLPDNSEYKARIARGDISVANLVAKRRITDADEDMRLCNSVNIDGSYNRGECNCGACSVAYDMRRRGYNVSANEDRNIANSTGMYGTTFDQLLNAYDTVNGEDVTWKEARYTKDMSGSERWEEAKSALNAEYPDNARGAFSLYFSEKEGYGGHTIAWEKVDGELKMRDCQLNKVYTDSEMSELFAATRSDEDGSDWDGVAYTALRFDDKIPNSDVLSWVGNGSTPEEVKLRGTDDGVDDKIEWYNKVRSL